MNNADLRPAVRVRRRVRPQSGVKPGSAPAERLVADDSSAFRSKRKPNSGSFKKGEPSRNPNGRPKGAKGKKAVVRKVLLERVTVRLPVGSRKLTVFEALVLKERDLAFAGDWRARKTLLELARWALPEDVLDDAGVTPAADAETDRAILAWFEEEVRAQDHQRRKVDK